MRKIILFISFIHCFLAYAQQTPISGVSDRYKQLTAFTNANIVLNPQTQLKSATLLIQEGRILKVGEDIQIPEHAVIIDLEKKWIYPGFIDIYANLGLPSPQTIQGSSYPQYNNAKEGAYDWNDANRAWQKAVEDYTWQEKEARAYLKNGFTNVLSHYQDGIFRGTGTFVNLSPTIDKAIVKEHAATFYSFDKGSSKQQYPNSLMGAMALMRQTFADAIWYENKPEERTNLALNAIGEHRDLPKIIEVSDYLNALRANRLGDEFGTQFIVKAGNDLYKDLGRIGGTGATFIIDLKTPKAYDIVDPLDALNISLADMKHWEMAPFNAMYLQRYNIPFVLTSSGMDAKKFWGKILALKSTGVTEQNILSALTTTPAALLNLQEQVGTLEGGKYANFIITDASIFDGGKVLQTWVQGEKNAFEATSTWLVEGSYNLMVDSTAVEMTIQQQGKENTVLAQSKAFGNGQGKMEQDGHLVSFYIDFGSQEQSLYRFSGRVNFEGKILDGKGEDIHGVWFTWTAVRKDEAIEEKKNHQSLSSADHTFWHPFQAYGREALPQREDFFIRGATVWTCSDSQGVFVGDVIVRNGQIESVGKQLSYTEDLRLINGKKMHLTPGIIDEHSHIAVSGGVNEAGQASSAEVSIGDVVNPNDVNLYRQLAGGVTTAQLLHGSANPIGGQSALIKIRYGLGAEQLKISGAPKFIKFALGENVKQSNWGSAEKVRYPQTRMGVEQVFYDHFYRAQEYKAQQSQADSMNTGVKTWPVVRNIVGFEEQKVKPNYELEILAEILDKQRFITCHSYKQSEINMLMHVADSMGFRVNTFTHILEGYKVADKMKRHGVAGSTFSDWWAYKYEVKDAIPYNAAIMAAQGVLVGINSDDAEMGRRLNQEAAKAVKYGGVEEHEALKMVTANPAKILHLYDKVGSIEPGKDADLVLWTDHPLSVYAKAQTVWIEGAPYFSLEENAKLTEEMNMERNRLIHKMLQAIEDGAETQEFKFHKHKHMHCDTLLDDYLNTNEQ